MSEGGEYFVKGGCGCLGAFVAVGLVVAALGGRFFIDVFGAAFLFGIGGVIGLLYLAALNKGREEGRRSGGPDRGAP